MQEFTERFLKFEKRSDLSQLRFRGVPIWEQARVRVFDELTMALGLLDVRHDPPRKGWRTTLPLLPALLSALIFRNPLLVRSKRDLLFLGHSRRKLQPDRRWWDIYVDPLIEDRDPAMFWYLERPFNNRHRSPVPTPNRLFTDSLSLLAAMERWLRPLRWVGDELERILPLERDLAATFGVQVDLTAIFREEAAYHLSQYPWFRRALRRLGAKTAVVLVSYGNEVFIRACLDEGVKVVELQHGTIHRQHMGYHFPRGSGGKSSFPQHLFLFGETWREMACFPLPTEKIHTMGFPHFEDISGSDRENRSDSILFISQKTIGHRLVTFCRELADRVAGNWTLRYKLHPGEFGDWRREYPELLEGAIEILDKPTPPLQEIIGGSRVCIGVYSTAILEALQMGLKLIVIRLPGWESLEPLLAQYDSVRIVDTVEEAEAAINDREWLNRVESIRIFESGGRERFWKVLNDVS